MSIELSETSVMLMDEAEIDARINELTAKRAECDAKLSAIYKDIRTLRELKVIVSQYKKV